MNRRVKKILIGVGILLALLLVGAVIIVNRLGAELERLSSTPIAAVDLTTIQDGAYEAYYQAKPVDARVRVTVKDHTITEIILLEHGNGKGKPAEVIVDHVVQAQSLQVDVITGATYSSKVILLAIEAALQQGVEK